jgi:hypothetical protein
MVLARRDAYGFLFSVRRAFINRLLCHSHGARFVLGQLTCRAGEAMRTEKEPVIRLRGLNFARPFKTLKSRIVTAFS